MDRAKKLPCMSRHVKKNYISTVWLFFENQEAILISVAALQITKLQVPYSALPVIWMDISMMLKKPAFSFYTFLQFNTKF
jgi:hypothetical protein